MWKVMIVDDEKLICRLVKALVKWDELGMESVATADNALEALELLGEVRPDILITDIRMPGMDGLELIREVKKRCPEIEIIIISGYAHFEYAKNAIALGVGNYILKPINQEELNKTLLKIGERLKEKKYVRKLETANRQATDGDKNRLRKTLLEDLISGHGSFSMEQLTESYYFDCKPGFFRTFILQMDYDPEEYSNASMTMIQEKTQEIFNGCLSGSDLESIFDFVRESGYGVLNYQKQDREYVRHQMREFIKQMDANKEVLGNVEFSLALGEEVMEPSLLAKSVQTAEMIICERLVEGCGRMLEVLPAGSSLRIQEVIDKFCKASEHAIDTLSLEEAEQATEALKESVLSVNDVCGREIQKVVLAAGRFYILRVKAAKPEIFEEKCRHCGTVKKLFQELLKLQKALLEEAASERQGEASRPIRFAKQYVHKNFANNITLEEVSEYVGFSVAYFSALFKKETGEGFAKYLTRIRMEEAKNLLRETGIPVSEICEKVGYSDRKHFTHTFHKLTGVNPAEYRKLYG